MVIMVGRGQRRRSSLLHFLCFFHFGKHCFLVAIQHQDGGLQLNKPFMYEQLFRELSLYNDILKGCTQYNVI